jgi:PEP-CTERM motif
MKFRVTSLLFLAVCFLVLSGIPAHAIDVLYNNGGGSEFLPMWDISGSNMGSNQFTCSFGACNTQILEFDATPTWGTDATTVNWSVTSSPLGGGTTFASGTSALPQIYACDPDGVVCLFDINFATSLSGGSYFLNLSGVDAPLGWDTTSHPLNGTNAYSIVNGVETDNIQGMGFKIEGTSTPEPGSILLFGSGLLGAAGMLRRRFLN